MSKLIVMLTHNDETVPDSLKVFESCKELPIEYWGFKNIGLPLDRMKQLVKSMKNAGKTTFLEVVTLSEQECMEGASMAIACGFDYLLGTVFYPSVAEYARKKHLKYLPFCGKVSGHPSILEGSVEDVVEDALKLQAAGCQGTDLLAYRHKDCPEQLISALIKRARFPVVVAGSIDSFERIGVVLKADPWTFTIGSALFEGKFGEKKAFRDQLQAVIDYMDAHANNRA